MTEIAKFQPYDYREYRIMMSGRNFIKVISPKGYRIGHRVRSHKAAMVLVDSKGRVMTPEEHALVHPH